MPYTTTARQLFDTVVPAFVEKASVDIAGPVLFEIEGKNGGVWIVDFQKKTVTAGRLQSSLKAIVRAQDGDFIALVEGRMSPADGLLTKRLHVAGDAAAIATLMGAIEQLRAG
jgi:putative sterol carrier protein